MTASQPDEGRHISAEAYPLALEVALVGVWEWHLRTNDAVWSQSWPALLGMRPEDLPDGMEGGISLVHPDDRPALVEARDELIAGAPQRELRYRLRHADGTWMWVRGAASVLRDDAGRPERLVLAVVDVNEHESRMSVAELRRGVEEVARRSAAALLTAGDEEIDDVIVTGLRRFGTLLDVERVSLFLSGAPAGGTGDRSVWSSTDVGGTGFEDVTSEWLLSDVIPPEPIRVTAGADVEGTPVEVRRALATHGLHDLLGLPFVSDGVRGALVLCSARKRWWPEDADVVLRAFGDACVHALERRRLVRQLEEAHRHLRHLVDRAPLTMWRLSEDSDRLSYLTSNVRQLLGADAATVQDDWVERVHPDDRPVVEQAVAAVRAGREQHFELRFRHEDGRWRTFEIFVRPDPGEDGGPRGAVGYSMDVSDRRAAEVRVRRAERLEAVGQLAGGIAHEFNNLLTVMQGYMELAREGDVGLLDEAIEAGQRAGSLVERLLTFSRQRDVEPVSLDLNVLVRSLQHVITVVAHGIDVTFELTEPLPLVRADAVQLERALLNLVVNARDAMPSGGRLRVRTDRADPPREGTEGFEPGAYVRLRIEDTGTGMVPEVERRAFEPFFTTKAEHGTGLGLSAVHGAVAAVGGAMRIDTAVDAGTTVEVFLRAVTAEPPRDRSVGGARSGGASVLVVEDQPQLATLVRTLLAREGYDVRVAPDGDEALALAGDRMPDLLLTDIALPTLSGPEVAAALRARDPHLAVLYVSGYPGSSLSPEQRAALLPKPFNNTQLLAAVAEALEGR